MVNAFIAFVAICTANQPLQNPSRIVPGRFGPYRLTGSKQFAEFRRIVEALHAKGILRDAFVNLGVGTLRVRSDRVKEAGAIIRAEEKKEGFVLSSAEKGRRAL